LLAAALVLVGVGSVGFPGLAAFDARLRVIDLALDPPFAAVAVLASLASAGYYARLLGIGVRPASAAVALAAGVMPHWPDGRPARLSPDLARGLPAIWNANRAPAAASAVLLLAALGLAVASGALHGPAVAAAPGPWTAVPEEVVASPSPAASTARSPAPSSTGSAPPSRTLPPSAGPAAPAGTAPVTPPG
jgi:hypothetical protein